MNNKNLLLFALLASITTVNMFSIPGDQDVVINPIITGSGPTDGINNTQIPILSRPKRRNQNDTRKDRQVMRDAANEAHVLSRDVSQENWASDGSTDTPLWLPQNSSNSGLMGASNNNLPQVMRG